MTRRFLTIGLTVAALAGCGGAEGVQTGEALGIDALQSFLPEVSGWTRSGVKGQTMTMPVTMTHVEARYEKDGMTVTLDINDSAFNELALVPFKMFLKGFEARTDDGYKKSIDMGGMPGIEDWNGRSRRGELTLIAADRFVIVAKGRNVDNLDPIRAVLDAVNTAGMPGGR